MDEPCLGLAEAVARRVYDALAEIHEAGTTLIVVEEAPKRALTICDCRVEVRNGVASAVKFGNLIIAGLITGSIYAVFAVCVSVWYRVSNILNLAVGDFAMAGALGVDNLYRVKSWPLPAAIAATLAVVIVFAYVYDLVVLRLAQDGPRRQEGIVITFFFTFALSFFIDGVAKILFGTDVHAAPSLWPGGSLTVASSLHIERAGVLVLACALIIGSAFWLYIRYTLGGKAMEACGENPLGARIAGIDTRKYRRYIFVGTAVIAAVFGIVESPITGFIFAVDPRFAADWWCRGEPRRKTLFGQCVSGVRLMRGGLGRRAQGPARFSARLRGRGVGGVCSGRAGP